MKSFAKVSIALEINALFADNYILTSQGAEVSSLYAKMWPHLCEMACNILWTVVDWKLCCKTN